MHCSRCGSDNEPGAQVCASCGAGLSVGDSLTQEQAREVAYYEAAIGPRRTGYYLRQFSRFSRARGLASWNWPAFFFTFPWMLYRKMWFLACIYFLFPFSVVVFAWLLFSTSVDALSVANGASIAYAVVAWVLVPVFANALYFGIVRERIRRAKRFSSEHDYRLRYLAIKGGTSKAALIGVLIFFVPMMVGVSYFAVSSYSEWVVRGQVARALIMAEEYQRAIESTILADGLLPYDRSDAGLDPDPPEPLGRYVESIEIVSGRIDIEFGNEANEAIAGDTLSITPYLDDRDFENWRILWRCGHARRPPAATTAPVAYLGGTVDPRYLPNRCR